MKPNYHKAGSVEAVLRHLFALLTAMPDIAPSPLGKAFKSAQKTHPFFGDIKVPFSKPYPAMTDDSASLPFGFSPPKSVHLVGSWARHTATRPSPGAASMNVDVAVVMPAELFTERDALDGRYAQKRAFYLAVMAAAIVQAAKDKALPVHPTWECLGGDSRRPVLVLHPVSDGSSLDFTKTKTVIRLHVAWDPTMFKWANRLGPLRSGLRKEGDTPTPSYNSSVLLDGLALAHLVYLHKTAQVAPAFADACVLLAVWARQRGWGSVGTGGSQSSALALAGSQPGGFLLSMILAHLLHGEAGSSRLAGGLSSYQMFRAALDFLAGSGFAAGHVHFMSTVDGVPTLARHSADDWAKAFPAPYQIGERTPAILVDPTGSVNLLASTPRGSIDALAVEAARTRALLADANDAFRDVFLTRLSPVLAFDEVFTLPVPAGHTAPDASSHLLATVKEVDDTLRSALGPRAAAASPFLRFAKEVELSQTPSGPKCSSLLVGIHYHADHVRTLVDHGPPQAEVERAHAYKAFWEEKAELRRFRDGITRLAIVWPVPASLGARWAIPRQIICSALENHHGLIPDTVEFVTDGPMSLLEPDPELVQFARAKQSSPQTLGDAEHDLSNAIRRIDLPLSVARVFPSDAGLRGTDPEAPMPLNLLGLGSDVQAPASYLPAHTLLVEFEKSPRWPRDREALYAMQAALLERIAAMLPDELPEARTSVAFPHSSALSSGAPVVDVTLVGGYAFRLRIRLDVETEVLEDTVADSELPASLRTEARAAQLALAQETVYAPRLHQALAQVGHRFPAYGDATRLALRWVHAQLATPFIPPLLVELVMAHVFLRQSDASSVRSVSRDGPAGAAPPSSPVAGWIAFVRVLAEWRTSEEPLLVPVFSVGEEEQETLQNSEGIEVAHTHHGFPPALRQRALDAFAARSRNGAWVVATEEDPEGRWYTLPSTDTAAFASAALGLRTLAKQAVKVLSAPAAAKAALEENTLFHPPLQRYDFLIHLDASLSLRHAYAVSVRDEARDAHRLALAWKALGADPKPGFDTAEAFVSLLRLKYGDAVRLFHDPLGGTVVAGLWNPSLRVPRRFKASVGVNVAPVENKNVALNAQAILAEMVRLGQGLVDRVEIRQA